MSDEHLFELTATPELKVEGPQRGYLDNVVFTAKGRNGLYSWYADNNGNLVSDFSALLSRPKAIDIVKDLYLGRTVAVPGHYRIEQLRGKFGFTGMDQQI